MKPALLRTSVLGGATLLTLGVAGPALACGIGPEWTGSVNQASVHSTKDADPTLTLAEHQAKVDAKLAKTLTRLADAKTRVADSTKLSDAEKAAKTARIDALIATIDALRVQVAAETSIDAIKADVKAAFAPDVDDVKARLDARLAAWIATIDIWQAKIAADDSLDPAKQADKLAKLQAWEDKLVALRAQIAAATTLDEVKADLKAADIRGLSLLGKHHHGRHHHGSFSNGRAHDPASDYRTNSDRTRTSTVSFRFGDRSQDAQRHGGHDGQRHGGGTNDRSSNHGSGGGRGHFA